MTLWGLPEARISSHSTPAAPAVALIAATASLPDRSSSATASPKCMPPEKARSTLTA